MLRCRFKVEVVCLLFNAGNMHEEELQDTLGSAGSHPEGRRIDPDNRNDIIVLLKCP